MISGEIETWTELGIGSVVVLIRVFARWKMVGIRNLRGDDYLVVLTLLLWAGTCIIGVEMARLGSTAVLSVEEISELTPEEIPDIELGGKLSLLSWIFYVGFLWTAKTCLLFYYNSFSNLLWHEKRLIKIGAYLLGVTFCVVMITVLAQCGPIENNWRADPVPTSDCQYGFTNLYTSFSFHLLTDIYLLAVPLPVLFTISQVQLVLSHKFLLAVCVCSGAFTIAAALSSFILTLDASNDPDIGILWGNREAFVWTIFLNAPSIASIFRRDFWSKGNKSNPHEMSQHFTLDEGHDTKYLSTN